MSRKDALGALRLAYLRHVETAQNLSPHTVRAYGRDLLELVEGLDGRGVGRASEVDLFVLRRWLVTLRERRLAPRSVARKISAVRSFFHWLAERGHVAESPARALRSPRRPRRLPSVPRREEVERLLAQPAGDGWQAARDRALLETLYSTGARLAEAAGLALGDLDLAEGTALLRGKGRRERLAGLGGPCVAALDAYFEAAARAGVRRDRRAVFLNRFGGRLSARGVARALAKHARAAGLPSTVTPHSLRHAFATHVLSAGANLREVQELLGHKSVASTQIYTHLTLDQLQRVYDRAHPRAGKTA